MGACDVAELCDGTGSCPADAFAATSVVCRASAGACDVAETCDGQGSCPVDTFAALGTASGDGTDTTCNRADTCDGAGSCQDNFAETSVVCRASAGACDVAETCDGAGSCPADAFAAAGTACGDGTDTTCNRADTCDESGTCQANLASTSVMCRASTGACDVAETCDGSGSCPFDSFAAAGTACGDGTDTTCNGRDTCDGAGTCQDNFAAPSVMCRASAGPCDVAETCDGFGSCPADGFAAAGTRCGDPTDTTCNRADSCDRSGTCQANLASTSVMCRASAGECDVAETCDGSGSCPVDRFAAAGTACGDSTNTTCDGADTCNGSGSCLTNIASSITICRVAQSSCDIAESCDGFGSCPADTFVTNGTSCGSSASGTCNLPDTCDNGACNPNNSTFLVTLTGSSYSGTVDNSPSCQTSQPSYYCFDPRGQRAVRISYTPTASFRFGARVLNAGISDVGIFIDALDSFINNNPRSGDSPCDTEDFQGNPNGAYATYTPRNCRTSGGNTTCDTVEIVVSGILGATGSFTLEIVRDNSSCRRCGIQGCAAVIGC